MPRRKRTKRTTVKDLRTILRLTHELGLSVRAISERLGLSKTSVATYLLRAREAGLSWPNWSRRVPVRLVTGLCVGGGWTCAHERSVQELVELDAAAYADPRIAAFHDPSILRIGIGFTLVEATGERFPVSR